MSVFKYVLLICLNLCFAGRIHDSHTPTRLPALAARRLTWNFQQGPDDSPSSTANVLPVFNDTHVICTKMGLSWVEPFKPIELLEAALDADAAAAANEAAAAGTGSGTGTGTGTDLHRDNNSSNKSSSSSSSSNGSSSSGSSSNINDSRGGKPQSRAYMQLNSPDPMLSKYVWECRVPVVARHFDKCMLPLPKHMGDGLTGNDTMCLKRWQAWNDEPKANIPKADKHKHFLLVLGCGYAGTAALAKLFQQNLHVKVDHEWVRNHHIGGTTLPRGLVSWPATVSDLNSVPPCAQGHIYQQVRHPLATVNSNRKAQWDFKYSGTGLGMSSPVNPQHYVPMRFRKQWLELTTDVKTLLWWVSFNLLAEAQLAPEGAVGSGFTYKMEDLFEQHNITAVQHMHEAIFPEGKKDWNILVLALKRGKKINSHAQGEESVNEWSDVMAQSALELEAVDIARRVCAHYNYSNC